LSDTRRVWKKMKRIGKRAILLLITIMLASALLPSVSVRAIGVPSLDSYSGRKGETIIVTGLGVTAGVDVNVYWDGVKAWDGEKGLLNSTEAKASGAYEVWFDVPAALVGDHYIWVKDTDTGDTAVIAAPFVVESYISLSPDEGLPNDDITIKGYGFGDELDIVTVKWGGYAGVNLPTSPSTPETDELGSWSAKFEVPDVGYLTYWVYAEDEDGNNDDDDFKVGAAISLDVEEGPVGTVVEISGRGFTNGVTIDTGLVSIVGGSLCEVIDDDEVDLTKFKIECVIPLVPDEDDYEIEVTDGTWSATADFEVTGLPEIEVDPEFGVQGSTINIEGWNFTQISGEDVQLELWAEPMGALPITDIKKFETNSDGYFKGTFTVPARSSEKYNLVAAQDTFYIDASTGFRIGLMLVIISPSSGPSGAEVTITGTGFTDGGDWNATLGDILIIDDGTIDDDSNLELGVGVVPTFLVPTMDPGTYDLEVNDITDPDDIISVAVEFTVTDTTTVTTDPMVAPNEYEIKIKGKFFSAINNTDLDFVLYNVTADGEVDEDWDMTVTKESDGKGGAAQTDEDGNFTGYYLIEDEDVLSLGDYWINVTDENDLFGQVMFSVVDKTVDIEPRKPSFAVGDSVAFNIESSFKQPDSYIEILVPDGDLYWTTDLFESDLWVKVGTVERVPYYSQTAGGNPLVLEDVPLGTWSWTWYDDEDDEIDAGTFTVTEAPADILAQQLQTLTEDFAGFTEDFAGLSQDVSGLSTSVQALSADVSAAAAAAQAASNAVTNLAQTVGDIAQTANSAKTSADAAKTAADSAKAAADDAKTAASGLTTLVYGAIGASLVAALAAIVSLMQISRRIAG
jgi:uncharacterized protein YoxC